ncbi:AlbA family DNA-binding domain-containing protein [Methanosarcina mazei]|uniref:ATP-binding protein n=1 Tax=Methanosarcina mazei TaxID=2209 RepID=A0A4P8R1S9_METMZ|nr:ATP-binding protein [Methanosarcina mazei]QCR14825.1 ATP-binding protein [Methanosarcina mazei]
MLFKKSFSEVDYSDIQKLLIDKIEESEILDYKSEYQGTNKEHENTLLKEIAAFANTKGGFLLYGVKESGRGGWPVAINGIDTCNTERLEQVIISNIMPRISVQIKKVEIPETNKIVVVIRIPEGQNQPYYNNRSNKYYKRYMFEAKEMDEHEIEALYRRRFFGMDMLNRYIENTILFNSSRMPTKSLDKMNGHILITPLRVDERIIDSSNINELIFDTNEVRLEPDPAGLYLIGIPVPSRYGIEWSRGSWSNEYDHRKIEIHRNGLIHHVDTYGELGDEGEKVFWEYGLTSNFLQTIQFSALVYSRLNFVGKVKIIIKVMNSSGSKISSSSYFRTRDLRVCDAEEIYIEREWDSWRLEEDYLTIGKDMIDELNNYYGIWNSRFFKEESGGNILFQKHG